MLSSVKNLNPLICPMSDTSSFGVDEKKLMQANLSGFNNNVGKATNRASNIRDMMANFEKGSREYEELFEREQSIQRIQQSIIDSVKNSGMSESIPTEWYSRKANEIEEGDSEHTIEKKNFNNSILADKKPYFFIYIYDGIKKSLKEYNENWNNNLLRYHNISLKELLKNGCNTDLISAYKKNMPVSDAPSLMNKICHTFENEFDRYFSNKENKRDFDYEIYKSPNTKYNDSTYSKIKKLKNEYDEKIKKLSIEKREDGYDQENYSKSRSEIVNEFKNKSKEVCKNRYRLCNILVDICYRDNKGKSKQFVWDMAGHTIIKNLLALNNNEIAYFIKDNHGVINFAGETFTMKKKEIGLEAICQ